MDRAELIAQQFRDRGIEPFGSVLEDREHGGHYVFVAVEIDGSGKQVPSNYAISKAEKALEVELGAITVVLIGRAGEDIAASIKSMIIRRYISDVRNVFSSVDRRNVSVWIEPKSATSEQKSNEIREAIAGLVEYFGLELRNFINTSELNLPSETVCMSVIRKKSPALLKEIMAELNCRGFEIPEDGWLLRHLDRWRRNELIHRKSDGRYVMTVRGLKTLGSGKNRRSPDVVRALDMARRQH